MPRDSRRACRREISGLRKLNIVPKVQSKFRWKGKIDSANESLLIVKTREALLDKLIASVKGKHSYTVPEIIALPIVGGNKDYLDWIDEVTGG